MTSGLFREILSSSTLVPNGKLPNVKPLFKVVLPVPAPELIDLSTINVFTLFCLLIFSFRLDFLKVAKRVAPVSLVPKLLI